jgi:hypothetical protein
LRLEMYLLCGVCSKLNSLLGYCLFCGSLGAFLDFSKFSWCLNLVTSESIAVRKFFEDHIYQLSIRVALVISPILLIILLIQIVCFSLCAASRLVGFSSCLSLACLEEKFLLIVCFAIIQCGCLVARISFVVNAD